MENSEVIILSDTAVNIAIVDERDEKCVSGGFCLMN